MVLREDLAESLDLHGEIRKDFPKEETFRINWVGNGTNRTVCVMALSQEDTA